MKSRIEEGVLMTITPCAIADIFAIEPRMLSDERGFLLESFNQRAFNAAIGLDLHFMHYNYTRAARHVLRWLQCQAVQPQGKLVRVVSGEVFDVGVGVRPDFPTYGKWAGEVLGAASKRQLWVPSGLAHFFLMPSDSVDFLNTTTDYYMPEHKRCIAWNDPAPGIDFPLAGSSPILSTKDAKGGAFGQLNGTKR